MASSLDDRPEYETLQDELDRAAELWVNALQHPAPVQHLLSLYIEHICDVLYINDIKMINEAVAEDYIRSQDLSVWEFKKGMKAADYIRAFTQDIKRKNLNDNTR